MSLHIGLLRLRGDPGDRPLGGGKLAAYKVPRAVAFVADLPKTSTGKIMPRELRKLDL